MTGLVDIQADGEAVARRAADFVLERALAKPGRFAWCLSGGSTPKVTYALLATEEYRDKFPWSRTHLFIGDERFVPPDHPDSNEGMARRAMIDHVPIPAAQVHPWHTNGEDPEHAALHYADTLKRFYGADNFDPARPLFDVTFLGLGEDGHTASLFPGVAALLERTAWTAAVIGAKPEPRLTLTYPALDSSRAVVFLAAGAGKRGILARALAGDTALPSVGVHPAGELHWFTDKAAARAMTEDQQAALKRQAAEAAASLVSDGMVVGLGTGSTAYFAIAYLIARVRDGLRIKAVPTSERSAEQARGGGIELVELEAGMRLALTIDGADAVAHTSLDLVKGLGGALLREKMVAASSDRLLIVVDGSKLVDHLGENAPVPVEVVPFGWRATSGRIGALGARPVLRCNADGQPFHTDGGNLILDCHVGPIKDPAALDAGLQAIVGVVETGLFIGRTSEVFVADPAGVQRLRPQ